MWESVAFISAFVSTYNVIMLIGIVWNNNRMGHVLINVNSLWNGLASYGKLKNKS